MALDDQATELEIAVAREVYELPGVGWWRRKSVYSMGWELCQKGESTPDEPKWKSQPGYQYASGEGGQSLPNVSRDLDLAVGLATRLRPYEISIRYNGQTGTWVCVIITRRVTCSNNHVIPATAVSQTVLDVVRHMKKFHYEPDMPCDGKPGPCVCGAWHPRKEEKKT